MTINNRLTWAEYVTKTCNNVFSGVYSLQKMKDFFFTTSYWKPPCQILNYSLLTYCGIVVNDTIVELVNKLQYTQTYYIQFVFYLKDDHVNPYHNKVFLLKLYRYKIFSYTNDFTYYTTNRSVNVLGKKCKYEKYKKGINNAYHFKA